MAVGACPRVEAKSTRHGANLWMRSTPRAETCNSATNARKSTMGIDAKTLSDIDSEGTKLAENEELNALTKKTLVTAPSANVTDDWRCNGQNWRTPRPTTTIPNMV